MFTDQIDFQMDTAGSTRTAAAEPLLPAATAPDEELFARFARTGCERSFELIFERYAPRIRGFLLRRIGDEAKAEDLTQSVFVRIIRAKHSFDSRKNFSTWSHTIANNVLKNHYRTVSRNRVQSFSDLEPTLTARGKTTQHPVHNAPAAGGTPELEAYRDELRSGLQAALGRLEAELREPFVLHQMQGLSYEEVAAELRLPVSLVRSRAQKARLQLRSMLTHFATVSLPGEQ